MASLRPRGSTDLGVAVIALQHQDAGEGVAVEALHHLAHLPRAVVQAVAHDEAQRQQLPRIRQPLRATW